MTRAEALALLLSIPDEPCMHRGHYYTYARNRNRDPNVIKHDLGTAYVEHMRQDHMNGGISCVVSVQRKQILKLARRA